MYIITKPKYILYIILSTCRIYIDLNQANKTEVILSVSKI